MLLNIKEQEELKNFIYEASRATYASGDENIKQKQSDGSTTIIFQKDNYKYHDNYFGGEPYGGREVIFKDDKPFWMMLYYGIVYEGANSEVYKALMDSLSNTDKEMPYRGPKEYISGEYKYKNELYGNVEYFNGLEKIYKDDVVIYEARYMGGLVDKIKE